MTKNQLIACLRERFPKLRRNDLLRATKDSLEVAVEKDHAGYIELTYEMCGFDGCVEPRLVGYLVCERHAKKPIYKNPNCTIDHPGSSCNVACGY